VLFVHQRSDFTSIAFHLSPSQLKEMKVSQNPLPLQRNLCWPQWRFHFLSGGRLEGAGVRGSAGRARGVALVCWQNGRAAGAGRWLLLDRSGASELAVLGGEGV